MIKQADYVELGLACADVCAALDRGLNGRELNDVDNSVREAIDQLTTWVISITHTFSTSLVMLAT